MTASSRRFKTQIVIGAIGVAITIALFSLAVPEPTRAQTTAYLVLLGAEILTTAGLAWIERASGPVISLMFRSGAYVSLLAYLTVAGFTAAVFIFRAGEALQGLLTLEAIWLGLLAASLTVLFASASSTAETNRLLQSQGTKLWQMENLLATLVESPHATAWAASLASCLDDLKFADHACSTPSDDRIAGKITDLEKFIQQGGTNILPEAGAEIAPLIEELRDLIAGRAREAADAKRGGY